MLQLSDVRSGYGSIEVLHGLSLDVEPGAVAAVIGTNGAGKTTLMRTLAGLLPTRAGRITFDGQEISGWHETARARAGLCLIPEGRGIFRQLSVYDNVAMFVRGKNTAKCFERAAGVFPKLGERRSQIAGTLSGGEQQMLAVSRALVTKPKMVMIDELSLGLAPVVIDQIFAAVDVLRGDGVSLLIIDQYLDRILDLADTVFFLRKGALGFAGGPDELRDPEILHRLHLGLSNGSPA